VWRRFIRPSAARPGSVRDTCCRWSEFLPGSRDPESSLWRTSPGTCFCPGRSAGAFFLEQRIGVVLSLASRREIRDHQVPRRQAFKLRLGLTRRRAWSRNGIEGRASAREDLVSGSAVRAKERSETAPRPFEAASAGVPHGERVDRAL